ncbi:hypothetical protein [Rhodococcus jostii]|uniref:hypothetical protein n=1 Tax=Rhodococcus jostii TaxID=132919 RepID=UPI0036618C9E
MMRTVACSRFRVVKSSQGCVWAFVEPSGSGQITAHNFTQEATVADPIDSIVSITRQVLVRLLGLGTAPPEPAVLHIHLHVHGEQPETLKAQFPFQRWGKR